MVLFQNLKIQQLDLPFPFLLILFNLNLWTLLMIIKFYFSLLFPYTSFHHIKGVFINNNMI